jgi:hypothetical protein
MEWIKVLGSARAWELVVALIGGYLAAKNLESRSRSEFLGFMIVAIVISFAAVGFALPELVERGYLSAKSASNLRPLAILLLAAVSLRLIDILYSFVAQLRDVKLSMFWRK